MEARLDRAALAALVLVIAAGSWCCAANYRTQHFIVTAADPNVAKTIGDLAEVYRRDLAIDWLGHELPEWSGPCPIRAEVAPHLGAGGATSFMFERGRPFGWQMSVQGSYERVLDSVITSGRRTRDIGGDLGCAAFGAAVREELERALAGQRAEASA